MSDLTLEEIEALEPSSRRFCEACSANIDHKRSDARFCDRKCKMAGWHRDNRTTTDGLARERERNRGRYQREAVRRKAGARDYYVRTRELRLRYSRKYRAENPHRRRDSADRRAQRMRENLGYAPYSLAEWERLKRRFHQRCAYCGELASLQQDHVIPLARGGRHAIANILPACFPCNASKSDSLLVEWRARLERG